MTKVCGWCGQPLAHRRVTRKWAETCEEAYGVRCAPAATYLAQLQHEKEMGEEVERVERETEEWRWEE